ncbi:gamma carbonic anhydrase [Tribonema minus]|uniref:Gamma carbonic anhydrase n=1 Tax=Tribonema minus TaxID=303371 RepID=A0A836C9Q3_9STRA|nr:gamma carbonic anhydrase [Tribonema minus]
MTFYQRGAYAFGGFARKLGRAIDAAGIAIEGSNAVVEKLQPATRLLTHRGQVPKVAANSFVAPTASLIGNVTLGEGASVWYGAVVRGDIHYVKIGDGTSIGDGAVVHVAKFAGDLPAVIGSNVTVGAKATVHACTLEDGCVVGAGATVLDGATVSRGAVLAAGALAPPRCVVPPNQVWAGSPAKYVRDVTAAEADAAAAALSATLQLARAHAAECAKDARTVVHEEELADDVFQRDLDIHHVPQPIEGPVPDPDEVEGVGVPGRIFNNALRHSKEELATWAGDGGPAQDLARARKARSDQLEEQARLTEGTQFPPRSS